MSVRIEPVSETSLIVYLGERIDPGLAPKIGSLCQRLRRQLADRLVEVVPSYTSILVQYHPLKVDFDRLRGLIATLAADLDTKETLENGRLIELPVYYHPEVAPDLAPLAQRLGLSIDAVIAHHSERDYRVFAVGFAPGFAFLGEVDERIAGARHPRPRPRVMAGSVGIAGRQTGVYPTTLPGGWQIIGNCPEPMYQPERQPASQFAVGDRVRFMPIDRDRYLQAGGELWRD